MTRAEYEIVLTLIDVDARERHRTLDWGVPHGPLSVGSRGDWLIVAEGVASVHLWLQFDGHRLYAASADAVAYVHDVPIASTWQEVLDGGELRFGPARIQVRLPRRLTAIERAAALPLPSFFTDRLEARRHSSSGSTEPPAALPREPFHFAPRARSAEPRSMRASRARMPWLWLLIPAALLPFIVAFVWLVGVGGSARVSAPPPPVSAPERLLASATAAAPVEESVPEQQAPLPLPKPPPALAPGTEPGTVSEALAPTTQAPVEPHRAYPQNLTDKPVPRIGAEPWMTSEEWQAQHERQLHAANRSRAKLIFLGDSITEGWGVSPAYRDTFGKYSPLNLGISSDVTQNVLWRIAHGALTDTHADVLVLMIGVNNLAGGFSPQQTVAGIRAIVAAIRAQLPRTRVLLLAILPARPSPNDPLRQNIALANQQLEGLAGAMGVSYHDVGAVLLEPDGTISKATLRDFVHPTATGYARLSEAVAPFIDALMGHAAE